nr:MAG TPA: hypothetical protein [Caudoviricetes sp.]
MLVILLFILVLKLIRKTPTLCYIFELHLYMLLHYYHHQKIYLLTYLKTFLVI